MTNLRKRFTKWYYRRGYRARYEDISFGTPEIRLTFTCPFWLRPITFLMFSPAIYFYESAKEG